MVAKTLQCHSCGAAVSSDSPKCSHCGARLATIACPACLGMMFQGSKFCPGCGTPAARWQSGEAALLCPGCEVPMLAGQIGNVTVHECERCFGLWLDASTFEQVCRDHESHAAVLGAARSADVAQATALKPVRYVKCPACRQLMHRMNFARCSGVVIDVCREHGSWFERGELQGIVEFIRAGGMDMARDRAMRELNEERRRLELTRRMAGSDTTRPVTTSTSTGPFETFEGEAWNWLWWAAYVGAGLVTAWLKRR
jgi:Zn-finger nucleic acid-binding protein